MEEQRIYKLNIDDNFKRLIPPLSPDELQQLEQNLVHDGCREPLCAWNNTILDGHNRYEICLRLQIPFTIIRIKVKSREEAMAWICTNQLGRRNITEETRRYLIGKKYEIEKVLGARNSKGTNQHSKNELCAKMLHKPQKAENACRTCERIGNEYRISQGTVRKYGLYSAALDRLSGVVPELIPQILSGNVKISSENTVELSQLPKQDILRFSMLMSNDIGNSINYSDLQKTLPKSKKMPKQYSLPSPARSIKHMPTHDPDAEISSISLTIPSWISSINRIRSATNLHDVSGKARTLIEKELLALKDAIDTMLVAIQEAI